MGFIFKVYRDPQKFPFIQYIGIDYSKCNTHVYMYVNTVVTIIVYQFIDMYDVISISMM